MSANNNKILVLAEDQNRCRDLTTILDFLGEQVWEVNHAALDKMTELNDVAAVILNGSDPDVGPALEKLVALDQGIPVLMIGDPDLSDLDAGISGHVIARMDWPLNYTKFVDSLYRAQVFRDQFARSQERGQQRALQLFRSLVGTSRSVQQVRQLMSQVADKEVSVLITGESGTGKEVVARNLHYH